MGGSRLGVLAMVAAGAFVVFGMARADEGGSAGAAQWTETQLRKGSVVFEHNAMEKLAASYVPAPSAEARAISCALARGEYESVQIGVYAVTEDLKGIRLTVESDVDVTVYHRIEPDVKGELAKGEMSWISWMDGAVYLQRGEVVKALAKGQSVNFWLTFRADEETAEGVHRGKIRIKPADKPITVVDLEVTVRPFELAAPRAAFGLYHREDMLPKRFGSWGIAAKTASMLYRDMAAHGQNSVSFNNAGNFREVPPRNTRLPERVGLAKEAGLVHPAVPCLLVQGNIAEIEEAPRKAAVAWLEAQRLEQGWPEMVFYGWDEPPYPAPGLRKRYLPRRDVSVRLVTAVDATAAYAYGDVHDAWIVIGGEITPEMRAEAGRLGAQAWTYSYRIWREGFEPLRQRYYAGMYTWANKLGGNFVWAYSHGHHGHVWWLPGSDEPMPTTAWEARREGVDDYRYLQMVEDCVAATGGDPKAAEAAEWLEALRARLVPVDPHLIDRSNPLTLAEYDAIRVKASDFIEKLGAPGGPVAPWPVTNLKDEGKAFRGLSVSRCIAGLGSSDTSERRAAAWALFEMGPEAAPAVGALIDTLDNPEVRIPVLRAFEAIGPDAHAAIPALTSLMSDSDAYVRLGATCALAGMARPPSWNADVNGYLPDDVSAHAGVLVPPLRSGLRDPDRAVAKLSSLGLFRCGGAAAPALSDAMDMVRLKGDGKTYDDGDRKEFGMRVLSGMGPAAASAVPALIEVYEKAKGGNYIVARTLAAIGPAAAEAIPVLEKYRTPENSYLADAWYALYCIRGDPSDLAAMAKLIGDESRPVSDWYAAVRFLTALGAEAASVMPVVKERLALLDSEPSLRRNITSVLFERVDEGAKPLRLLLR